jgi:hypothetical protein
MPRHPEKALEGLAGESQRESPRLEAAASGRGRSSPEEVASVNNPGETRAFPGAQDIGGAQPTCPGFDDNVLAGRLKLGDDKAGPARGLAGLVRPAF